MNPTTLKLTKKECIDLVQQLLNNAKKKLKKLSKNSTSYNSTKLAVWNLTNRLSDLKNGGEW